MTTSDLLILYCPGSRGDFLAAILTDTIDQCYQRYVIDNVDLNYHKIHGIGEGNNPWHQSITETDILKNRARSIRIKLDPRDYDLIAYFCRTKGLIDERIDRTHKYSIDAWEQKYRKLDIKFGHVVWFRDLFDVEFLQKFYQRFNNRPMPENCVPLIQHNIDLQFNYKP